MGFLIGIFKLLSSLLVGALVVVKFFNNISWQESFAIVEAKLREWHMKWRSQCPLCAILHPDEENDSSEV